ncbi:MAG: hypothetical protein WCI77_07790 [Candidatus Omnitrophota bacterium]
MNILLYFKSLFLKLIDKLFGRTGIFITFLGWFLLLTGLWMLANPERARRSLSGQSFVLAKGYVLISVLFLGTLLFSLNGKLSGVISFNILLVAIVLLVQVYFVLKKRIAQKINAWTGKVPIKFLRIYAIIQIFIAVAMLFLHKRIWY